MGVNEFVRVMGVWLVKKGWPWIVENVWPIIFQMISDLIYEVMKDLMDRIKLVFAERRNNNLNFVSQKIARAEQMVGEAQTPEEAARLKEQVDSWKELAETLQKENETLKTCITELSVKAAKNLKNRIADLQVANVLELDSQGRLKAVGAQEPFETLPPPPIAME